MVPETLRDFFIASTGVCGALIGLLFVAISVSSERLSKDAAAANLHRVRASAALTAFVNALVVSMFALIPGQKIGATAITVSAVGLVFVATSLLALARSRRQRNWPVRDAVFLAGLAITLVIQLTQGAQMLARPHDVSAVQTIATLVVVCALIGIARSWELIGGPPIGTWRELGALTSQTPARPEASPTALEPANTGAQESPTGPSRPG